MARLAKFGDVKRKAFLDALEKGARRYAAAQSVGVTYETIRLHMHKDPAFLDDVDRAEMQANELVEGSLFKAAVGGRWKRGSRWNHPPPIGARAIALPDPGFVISQLRSGFAQPVKRVIATTAATGRSAIIAIGNQ